MNQEAFLQVVDSGFGDQAHFVVPIDRSMPPEWIAQYRPLAASGVGIELTSDGGEARDISLDFLLPVVDLLPSLRIPTVDRIHDAQVLERAVNLHTLVLNCRGRLAVDLSSLPRLRAFEGRTTAGTVSVLSNPHLEYLEIYGPLPKSAPPVRGPVSHVRQFGPSVSLLDFEQPGAVREVERTGAREFDLDLLSELNNLTYFRLERCSEVRNLHTLNSLPHLEHVVFQKCTSAESWESFPSVPKAIIANVQPPVSVPFAVNQRRRGWAVWAPGETV